MNYFAEPPADKAPSQIDWVRLAALIDGEGCLSIVHTTAAVKRGRKTGQNVRVAVFNTDRRMTDWCKAVFGGFCTPHGRRRKPQHKQAFMWCADNFRAEWILKNTKPYMLIKQEQADICLKFRELIRASVIERHQARDNASNGRFAAGIPQEQIAIRDGLKAELSLVKKQGVAA